MICTKWIKTPVGQECFQLAQFRLIKSGLIPEPAPDSIRQLNSLEPRHDRECSYDLTMAKVRSPSVPSRASHLFGAALIDWPSTVLRPEVIAEWCNG